ncbi:MAG TPA: hypothetical protein VGH29_13225 [Candidatus Binataceae bacterium]
MNAKSFIVAGAAALLIVSGAITARADESAGSAQIKCMGVNSCKGQGSCASAKNDCKGKNACKGQGVTKMSTAKDCTDKGGQVLPSKKAM